jgi:hypothetical protein
MIETETAEVVELLVVLQLNRNIIHRKLLRVGTIVLRMKMGSLYEVNSGKHFGYRNLATYTGQLQ